MTLNSSHFAELRDYLYLMSNEIATAESDTAADKNTDDKEKLDTTQLTPPAAQSAQPSDRLKKLEKNDRLKLVWQYLCSENAQNDPFSSEHFAKCIAYIQECVDESSPILNGKPVELVESKFLRILNENLDLYPADSDEASLQNKTLLTAVQCRQLSESIIHGSSLGSKFDAIRHARAWPLIRGSFKQLEAKRREAEDALLANELDVAASQFAELYNNYHDLTDKLETLIRLQSLAQETLEIAPYLRQFLTNEAAQRETNPDIESQLDRINDVERQSLQALTGLQTNELKAADYKEDLNTLRDGLKGLHEYFRLTYFERLLEERKSASDVVFHGINLLASPIPEWLTETGVSKRSAIRSNVDKWISEQSDAFLTKDWQAFHNKRVTPTSRTAISTEKYDRLVRKADQYEFEKLNEFEFKSLLSVGQYLNLFKPGNANFKTNFDRRNRTVADSAALSELQKELAQVDFEVRAQNHVLSFAEFAQRLDVGPQLSTVDNLVVANDLLERSLLDFWVLATWKNWLSGPHRPRSSNTRHLIGMHSLPICKNWPVAHRGPMSRPPRLTSAA